MQTNYIEIKTVMYLTGLGRTSIYKFMSLGEFPKSISFTGNRIVWEETDIQNWIQEKIQLRNKVIARNKGAFA